MKKFTILFATLLAMSGTAFGQKEGKVLWENVVDSIPAGVYVSEFPINPVSSPSGNVFVQYKHYYRDSFNKDGVKLYDKNGKQIWSIDNFYQKTSTNIYSNVQNKNYALISYSIKDANGYGTSDSALYLNKDFSYIRKFDVQTANSFLITVEDGIFYNERGKTLVKYKADGKEEWRYDYDYPINILTRKAPYIGLVFTPTEKREMLIFDKNGNKIGSTEPQSFREILPTNDKGFWLVNNNFEYIKFDSTGKQTVKYSYKKGVYNYTSPQIFADNSILITFNEDIQTTLVKVSANGTVIQQALPSRLKSNNPYIYKIVDSQNRVMYSLRLSESLKAEADVKYKIGVIDFDNSANSWSKDLLGGASNGINGNAFSLEKGNIFFQAYSDPNQPSLKTFKTYDINGNLKWDSPYGFSSPLGFPLQWKIIDDHVYFAGAKRDSINSGSFFKVKFSEGSIVWKNQFVVGGFVDYSKAVTKDKNGNDIILYLSESFQPDKTKLAYIYTHKIATLTENGSEKWAYTLKKTDNLRIFDKTFFTSTNDGKLIVLSQETKDNKQQYILRKISPCEDLNAISITGSTEACPTEKVKLSIPKQEGVTYQWKRDGQDIPNARDAVYDFGESGTYTVVARDELCQNQAVSNALKVNIRPLSTAEITAPKTTFCDGEKVTIASRTNGTFFQWQKDGKDIPNATSGVYEVSQAGDYRVGVRDDKCPQVGYSNIYTMITKLLPEANITTDIKGVVYEPITVKMSANLGTGLSYQWLKDDAIIPNENKVTYEAKKSGKYNVTVTYDGCTKLSDALTISILIPLANSEEIGEEELKVYPNPSQGEFNIILPKTLKSADVQLFDTFGRERSLTYTGEQARADGLGKGVYFLRVSKGERSVTNKIVIE